MNVEGVDDDFLKATVIVTEHYIGGSHKADDHNLWRAFEVIGAVRRFDILGHAVFLAMLRADMERLRARRAALVAQLPDAPEPQLH